MGQTEQLHAFESAFVRTELFRACELILNEIALGPIDSKTLSQIASSQLISSRAVARAKTLLQKQGRLFKRKYPDRWVWGNSRKDLQDTIEALQKSGFYIQTQNGNKK